MSQTTLNAGLQTSYRVGIEQAHAGIVEGRDGKKYARPPGQEDELEIAETFSLKEVRSHQGLSPLSSVKEG